MTNIGQLRSFNLSARTLGDKPSPASLDPRHKEPVGAQLVRVNQDVEYPPKYRSEAADRNVYPISRIEPDGPT